MGIDFEKPEVEEPKAERDPKAVARERLEEEIVRMERELALYTDLIARLDAEGEKGKVAGREVLEERKESLEKQIAGLRGILDLQI
ncbi:MAG: hypothetical protein UY26_C0004G0016 [Candidatus Jorgensenbacteria bacterium GW2011_GWA1_48_13]|uniref:Uncharacterized protein n=2 Tax=Candidatus Joergenseniibacteriota TaxID=1752739 RepID=A0A0G1W7T4_9BACT|nr:MAG: hypothetical protein UY26_C0004G0016 [Candidatus Jorgensenbacteria bacterium GW2011_GWA1_48_13]KKU98683.1 MAG: hypothetical protein UY32_C0017G0017 [Candidatus Jorgensenbacteria bacterium GW2011_GWC1_48_8]KKW14763.1 MAG: hypothetical protein UY55_C0004G0016 [Candidatus Jorgensenbacteria bacterium GW2011_GWB1_50_10]